MIPNTLACMTALKCQDRNGLLQPAMPIIVAAAALCELRILAGADKRTKDRLFFDAGHSILYCLVTTPAPCTI